MSILLFLNFYRHFCILSWLRFGFRCSQRLANISCDKTLWERVDLRPYKMSFCTLKKCVQFLQASTKFLATQGFANKRSSNSHPTIPKSILRAVARNAPNLTTLILENHIIDSSKVCLIVILHY